MGLWLCGAAGSRFTSCILVVRFRYRVRIVNVLGRDGLYLKVDIDLMRGE